jgi:hypothetical protein
MLARLDHLLGSDRTSRWRIIFISALITAAFGLTLELKHEPIQNAYVAAAIIGALAFFVQIHVYCRKSLPSIGLGRLGDFPSVPRRSAVTAALLVILNALPARLLEAEIVRRKLLLLAGQAPSPEHAKEVRAVLSGAGVSGIQIEQSLIRRTAQQLLNASVSDPSAWAAVNSCISYQSTLISNPTPLVPFRPGPTAVTDPSDYEGLSFKPSEEQDREFQKRPSNQLVLELFKAGPLVPPERAYVLELLNRPGVHRNWSAEFMIVEARGGYIFLDGTRMRQVIIRNAIIVYDGGPTELQDVFFGNCTFQIKRTVKGIQVVQELIDASRIRSVVS